MSKSKACIDNKLNVEQMAFESEENIVGKGENVDFSAFFSFSHISQEKTWGIARALASSVLLSSF